MQFNLIGPGRLGQNLCLSLITHTEYKLQGVIGKNLHKTQKIIQTFAQGRAYADLNDLPQAPLTIITTPDTEIDIIIEKLCLTEVIPPGGIVIHCSGALSSACLMPLKEQFNALIASFHPLKPFSQGHFSDSALSKTHMVFEGDEDVLEKLAPAFLKCGVTLSRIDPKAKPLYHASAVFASNYPLLLLELTEKNLIKMGIKPVQAKAISHHLMQTALDNYQRHQCAKKALTGPLARGDVKTIDLHLGHLPREQETLYRVLGQGLLDLTELDDRLKLIFKKRFE
jgi:predicted short-subunit dehydrogenase-like oxidoreductase (DUF2520 family)